MIGRDLSLESGNGTTFLLGEFKTSTTDDNYELHELANNKRLFF